jgi:hypothetical protein
MCLFVQQNMQIWGLSVKLQLCHLATLHGLAFDPPFWAFHTLKIPLAG